MASDANAVLMVVILKVDQQLLAVVGCFISHADSCLGEFPGGFRFSMFFFPQQRKLMGSSAQISTGVRRCGSQEQVPEEGSGRFRKVPESSGVCWCRFRSRVPEGSGRFRRMLA